MDGGSWFITIAWFVLFVILGALTLVPAYARYAAQRRAYRLGITLPSNLEAEVEHRLMARQRGAAIGGILLTALAAVAFQWELGVDNDSEQTGLFIVGAAFAGIGIGASVAALAGRPAADPGRVRVARSNAVTVRDYVAPLELVGARAVVTVAVVVLIVGAVLAATGSDIGLYPIAFFAVFGAISLAVFEIVSRRIVGRPQPAGSTAELVWDDAVRASTLRDLVTAPLALGAYCLIFGVFGVTGTDAPVLVVTIVGGIFLAALVGAAIVTMATRPDGYFLRRLWPDLRWSDTAEASAPTSTDAA